MEKAPRLVLVGGGGKQSRKTDVLGRHIGELSCVVATAAAARPDSGQPTTTHEACFKRVVYFIHVLNGKCGARMAVYKLGGPMEWKQV